MKIRNLTPSQVYIADLNITIMPYATVEISATLASQSTYLQQLIHSGTLTTTSATGAWSSGSVAGAPRPDTTTKHSSLAGLDKDDHPQYVLASGTRGFAAPVEGKDPTLPEHLTTQASVDAMISAMYGVGDTASRPHPVTAGFMYFDTDLGYPIWFDGSCWVDSLGTVVYCY